MTLGGSRMLVEQCAAIRAEPRLIGGPLSRRLELAWPIGRPEWIPAKSVRSIWPTGEQTDVTIDVLFTRQRLGGQRRWWRCPRCHRRCGVLLSPSPAHPFACRVCWRAVYTSGYPSLRRHRWLLQQLGAVPGGIEDLSRELERLAAPRRKGIRRGRRVRHRALRVARRMIRESAIV